MNSDMGSQWRKWDFHVHTPYSILNNQYSLNADEPLDFDEFVKQLFTKAVEKNVWAIGITDYFSIDGYKRIRNDYLANSAKMAQLFPSEEIRERIRNMLVFPNIEFRLDRFITKGGKDKPIGYHVIFSDAIAPEEIEENFLHKLRCAPSYDQSWTLTKRHIEQFGKKIINQQGGDNNPYKRGLENVSIDEKDVLAALKECESFNAHSIIAIPVDEALSLADWKRSYTEKKSLYEQCHCYMTSNKRTHDWALEEERISEFGGLKPCIWGSDAHSFDRMFEPAERRYCWVKADLTFEGLMQILCEPADRIAIQAEKPEQHDPHRSIESVQLHGAGFQSAPIYFNEGLTCIIGGRSTGKSLLLRQLARSISPEYAIEQEKNSSLRPLDNFTKADVLWRDGKSTERKIIYLPQTYLNRTVDDRESGESGASKLVEDVLLQNEQILEAHESFERAREMATRALQEDLRAYWKLRGQLEDAYKELSEHGASELFEERVVELATEYGRLSGPGGASNEDLKKFSDFEQERAYQAKVAYGLETDRAILKSLDAPSFSGLDEIERCNFLSEDTAGMLEKAVADIRNLVESEWSSAIDRIASSCEESAMSLKERIKEIDAQLEALRPKVGRSAELSKAMAALNDERKKLIMAKRIEEEIEQLRKELDIKRDDVLSSRSRFVSIYEAYGEKISPLSKEMAGGLVFSAEVVWRKNDFELFLADALDGRKLSSFAKLTEFDLQDLVAEDYGDELLRKIWAAVDGECEGCQLHLKRGITESEFLNRLFSDWYNIHYVVTSDGDRLDEMSPGKKGLVLLELIVELEQGDCPILIDQPEDDLDNQSIYTELRRFIKLSKKRRQIIIVTHNANIALGADAEEIIISNQNGVGRENANYKFEYRSGAIENNVRPDGDPDAQPFLSRYSIQEHACQILDGGKEAIDQRRRKYALNF